MHKGAIVYSDSIEALRRFRGGQAIRVGLRRAPAVDDIKRLPGVASAEVLDGFVRVLPGDGHDPTEAIVRASVEGNWVCITGARSRQPRDVFVQLTTAEPV